MRFVGTVGKIRNFGRLPELAEFCLYSDRILSHEDGTDPSTVIPVLYLQWQRLCPRFIVLSTDRQKSHVACQRVCRLSRIACPVPLVAAFTQFYLSPSFSHLPAL